MLNVEIAEAASKIAEWANPGKVEVKIKKLHGDAVIPSYAKAGDAGLDLTSIGSTYDDGSGVFTYHTGLAVEIPEGYVGLIYPRSSIYKTGLQLVNSVGVIDSGYRGEIMCKFVYSGSGRKALDGAMLAASYNPKVPVPYNVGDRVAQLVIIPIPTVSFTEVDNLEESARGEGGFGSTGTN